MEAIKPISRNLALPDLISTKEKWSNRRSSLLKDEKQKEGDRDYAVGTTESSFKNISEFLLFPTLKTDFPKLTCFIIYDLLSQKVLKLAT